MPHRHAWHDDRMRSNRTPRPPLLLALAGLLAVAVVQAPVAHAGTAALREARVIGTSAQGRPIVAVHRWRPGATRTVLVIGSMHGDERAGLRVVHRLATRPLPTDVDLWLIRSVNPDGTAAGRRTNAQGVDLNRNFPRRWVPSPRGTATWSGPSAASEPETRAVLRFVKAIRPRTTVVFHQPLFGVDSYRAKSMLLVRALSQGTGLPVRSFGCHGGCHGTFTDWHNDRTRGRAVTIELGHSASDRRIGRVARAVLVAGGVR
jgi:protein MpaA